MPDQQFPTHFKLTTHHERINRLDNEHLDLHVPIRGAYIAIHEMAKGRGEGMYKVEEIIKRPTEIMFGITVTATENRDFVMQEVLELAQAMQDLGHYPKGTETKIDTNHSDLQVTIHIWETEAI